MSACGCTPPTTPWRRVAIGANGVLIRLAGDETLRCRATFDDPGRSMKLACRDHKATLQWTRDGDTLRLDGTLDDQPFQATLQRRDDSKLPINAGFRWFM